MANPETVPYTDFQKVQLANQALQAEAEKHKIDMANLKEELGIARPPRATLFGKMAEVMKAVKRVPKNGWNTFHKYAYPTETDLLEAVREILAEAGIALMVTVVDSKRELLDIHDKYNPTNPEKTKKNWFTHIIMEFTLGCTDTGETVKSRFHGEGGDNDDKGLYKAYTNTMKYFLRQTFLIPTGDTQPEDDGRPMDVEYDKQQQQGYNAQNGQKNNGGGNDTKNQNKTQNKPSGDAQMITRESLVEKWKVIGGTDTNFNPFYDKQIKDGKNHAIINKWLDMKIAERKKQQAEAAAEKKDGETDGKTAK